MFALGVVPTASAIDPIDWINTVLLRRIKDILATAIYWEQRFLDKAQIDVYNRYRNFFVTNGVFNFIRASTAEVEGIRRELGQLSCGWQFSPRTMLLQRLYLEPIRLCRPSFQAVWGSHTALDRDLHEFADYTSVLTANQIATRVQSEHDSFTRAFRENLILANGQGFSPGEANRSEALTLAMTGEVLVGMNQLQGQKLLVDEIDRELDRSEERHRASWSAFVLAGARSLGGGIR